MRAQACLWASVCEQNTKPEQKFACDFCICYFIVTAKGTYIHTICEMAINSSTYTYMCCTSKLYALEFSNKNGIYYQQSIEIELILFAECNTFTLHWPKAT